MTSKPLDGKVAIITGGGRGMGRAIAVTLARNGARVAIAARTLAQLQETAAEVERAGSEAAIFPMDLTVEENALALVRGTVERFGRLDILVNDAGMGGGGPWETMPSQTWDSIMALNARTPFILSREALPHMKKQGAGWIINLLAIGGIECYAGYNAYAVSKNALRALSITLSKEVRKDNIRVHAISMGGTDTTMFRKAARPDVDPDKLIQPQEIADLALFLITWPGNGVIDQINIRRPDATYWI